MGLDIIGWVKGWHLERFIKSLFDNSQKLWDKISPQVQEIIKDSSGVVELIKKMQGHSPQFVLDKITERFPFFTPDKLNEILSKTTQALNIANDVQNPDVLTMIAAIDKRITTSDPSAFEGILHSIASFIALFATPQDTTFGVITGVLKYVYKNFIEGKVKI